MAIVDWIILAITLLLIIAYGLYKSRKQNGAETYLLADRKVPWYIVLTGIMATQASAITFLSAPGQAYTDGMRFVQYYFGLPLAMLVISFSFVPIFRKMKVFTAYEYLETRFDKPTRLFTSFLFLLSRGLSTGISIYAPAIIIATILGLNIYISIVLTGGLLLIYTWAGGASAVAHTQKLLLIIILSAMAVAGFSVVHQLPAGIGFKEAVYIAGQSGRMNVITTAFSWKDKYNIWSGVAGGFFLALSYFGTDQTQVGRYITARNEKEGRVGLLLNGLVKIPLQFLILLIGVLVFSFYCFRPAPLHFNSNAYQVFKDKQPVVAAQMEQQYAILHSESSRMAYSMSATRSEDPQLSAGFLSKRAQMQQLRDSVQHIITRNGYSPDSGDTNYIFLYFVQHSLPAGLVGLVFAVIILASWGSISAALNALAATSLVDIHLDHLSNYTNVQQVKLGRLHTLGWGVFCVFVAMFAARLGSLIEAVNVLGSLFYGTILGIFLVAFYCKSISGKSVLRAAVIAEAAIIVIYCLDIVSFLWLNVAGALFVIALGYLFQLARKN